MVLFNQSRLSDHDLNSVATIFRPGLLFEGFRRSRSRLGQFKLFLFYRTLLPNSEVELSLERWGVQLIPVPCFLPLEHPALP